MAASFPSSVKAFSTKANNDTIDASHVDDLQDEVSAIETDLLNGLAHTTFPLTDNTYDLGTTTKAFKDVYVKGNLKLAGQNVIFARYFAHGRLTLTTAVPVTTADVTAATTLYYTPYAGNYIGLYDGSAQWNLRTFAELSIAIPATTSQMYDVFVFDNAGTPTLELLAWTNDTTRATALVLQDGVLVKSGATTRRYVGSFRTTTVSGQTEDSFAKRYVWNYYNRVRRGLRITDTTDTWTYTTAAFRQANGAATNQVEVVVGWAESAVRLTAIHRVYNNNAAVVSAATAIGYDSTTTPATGCLMSACAVANTVPDQPVAELDHYPAIGRHFYAWLEYSVATGTATWAGDSGVGFIQTGMTGSIDG